MDTREEIRLEVSSRSLPWLTANRPPSVHYHDLVFRERQRQLAESGGQLDRSRATSGHSTGLIDADCCSSTLRRRKILSYLHLLEGLPFVRFLELYRPDCLSIRKTKGDRFVIQKISAPIKTVKKVRADDAVFDV